MIVRTGGGWLARIAFAALGLAVAVVAFFALTIALVIGAVLALAIAVRWWWLVRRARKAAATAAPLEGEYTIVDREPLDGPR
jgi:membrane protein implicated in regulation of membrane protease activity